MDLPDNKAALAAFGRVLDQLPKPKKMIVFADASCCELWIRGAAQVLSVVYANETLRLDLGREMLLQLKALIGRGQDVAAPGTSADPKGGKGS